MCTELQSDALPLFIPCPNAQSVGENKEKFVPNPSSKSGLHLSMFSFVGKLMGIAIRGSHVLNLDLPSMVWKPLVGQVLNRMDLKMIDTASWDMLEKIGSIEKQNVNEESVRSIITNNFVITSSDGREVELKEGGKNVPVTWQNRKEFVQLAEDYKLSEFKTQVDAIRRGLATIVPIQLLPLFTWQELEMMVCGKREINIDYLKANTRYRAPVGEHEPHVQMFWQVMEGFSHDERQMFLRFVWGQSRLPLNPADFQQKFEIMGHRNNTNAALPISHTCFFQLELPRYTQREAMRDKLLYAIKNCNAIDGDFVPVDNVDWEAE
jgi:hypothetical protein